MSRPLLLDLFCCAGGAAMGYYRAGFDVIGIDIKPQPNYPFEFQQRDALKMLEWVVSTERALSHVGGWGHVAAIHASPPCQSYLNLGAVNRKMGRRYEHADLISATRKLLIETGLPYVIENVADAKPQMLEPVRVCGTGLGLPLRRHRLFESNVPIVGIPCDHQAFNEPKYWTGWRPKGEHRLSTVVQVYGNAGGREHWPSAMGIDWMTGKEMCEAVPPAYTEHIGAQLLESLEVAA